MNASVGGIEVSEPELSNRVTADAHVSARHIVIVGGGIMAAALAYALSATSSSRSLLMSPSTSPSTSSPRITVLERDPLYRIASSSLSASSIRQQFSQPVNIHLSRWSFSFYANAHRLLQVAGRAAPALALHECGYCTLASPAGETTLRQMHALQRAEGVDLALLLPNQLQQRFPSMAVADLACATLGLSGEGWFDGPAALQALRRKAMAQGAAFQQGEVVDFVSRGRRITAVKLADGRCVAADDVVLCAGAWSATLAAKLGIDLPVAAHKRDVFYFSSPFLATAAMRFPLVVDPCGLWFRPEGRGWLCGGPPRGHDPKDAPLEVDHGLFSEVLWPALAHRIPAFEAARIASSWAGYYEMNTFDANGLVGALPGLDNGWTACGFSGHGLKQAPAVGQALADLMLTGGFVQVDAQALSPARIAAGRPLRECNVI